LICVLLIFILGIKKHRDLNSIIIAGGPGFRLNPLTNEIPKCMVKLFGKSLLERQINILRKSGISDITVVTGYLSELVNYPNINFIKNENYKTTNINEGLFCAKEKLNNSIVCYGDIIYEENVLKQLLQFNGDIGIAVRSDWEESYKERTDHPTSEAENVLIENKKIIKIKKNIVKKKLDQQLTEFLGMMKLSKKGSEILLNKYNELQEFRHKKFHNASSLDTAYITDMLQELIDSGIEIKPIVIDGIWNEIDTIQDFEIVKKRLANVKFFTS